MFRLRRPRRLARGRRVSAHALRTVSSAGASRPPRTPAARASDSGGGEKTAVLSSRLRLACGRASLELLALDAFATQRPRRCDARRRRGGAAFKQRPSPQTARGLAPPFAREAARREKVGADLPSVGGGALSGSGDRVPPRPVRLYSVAEEESLSSRLASEPGFGRVSRWVLEPHAEQRLLVKFSAEEEGNKNARLVFRVAGDSKVFALHLKAACSLPRLSGFPEGAFSLSVERRKPSAASQPLRKCFVKSEVGFSLHGEKRGLVGLVGFVGLVAEAVASEAFFCAAGVRLCRTRLSLALCC